MSVGLAAVLLPCLVSGYMLHNSKWAMLFLPERLGANTYFRILLVGWLWWLTWLVIGLGLGADWLFLANWWAEFVGAKLSSADGLHRYWYEYLLLQQALLATVSAIIARGVLDGLFRLRHRESLVDFHIKVLQSKQRRMEAFILASMQKSDLVMMTMGSGKVYIGFANIVMNAKGPTEWVELIPLASGYRKKTNRKMKITNNYVKNLKFDGKDEHEYVALALGQHQPMEELNRLKMLLPVNSIVSVQGFHDDVYEQVSAQHKARKKHKKGAAALSASVAPQQAQSDASSADNHQHPAGG